MTISLRLDDLVSINRGRLTPEHAAYLKQNCMVCMYASEHRSGVAMRFKVGDSNEHNISIVWEGQVTPIVEANYRDLRKRVDFGSCAIALLAIPTLTGYAMVEVSATGDGVDYYLVNDGSDDLIFNGAARLEVSGIQRESTSNTVERRIADKRNRLREIAQRNPSPVPDPPTYICIVEFGAPRANMVLV